MGFNEAILKRFWSKVDKSGGADACWPWLGFVHSNGYGQFWLNHKFTGAHRFSLICSGFEPDINQQALHSCDNRTCCNPCHIRWGSIADNMKDRGSRSIAWKNHLNSKEFRSRMSELGKINGSKTWKLNFEGKSSMRRKVDDGKREEILKCVSSGVSQGKCALIHGVSQSYVCRLVSGKRRG